MQQLFLPIERQIAEHDTGLFAREDAKDHAFLLGGEIDQHFGDIGGGQF